MDRRFLFFQILFGSVSTIFTKIDRSVWASAPSNSPCTKTTCPMLFKIRGCLDVSKMLAPPKHWQLEYNGSLAVRQDFWAINWVEGFKDAAPKKF